MRRILLPLAAVAAIAGFASGAGAATAGVNIEGFAFVPATIQIKAGDSVTWTNKDSASHTVSADDGSFDSDPNHTCTGVAPLGCTTQGGTYSHTFSATGSFAYHCRVHSGMHGTVIVTAPPTTATHPATATTRSATATTRSVSAGATTTTGLGGTTTTDVAPGDAVGLNDSSTSTPTGNAVAKTKGGGNGSGAIAAIVAGLAAVSIGGGAALWRLRPRR